jgi:hypothetical protein
MASNPNIPGPNAGLMSQRTEVLRGPQPLTQAQRLRARFLRFDVGKDWPDIASELGCSEAGVRHALANARTRHSSPERRTANISNAAYDWLRDQQKSGEAIWQTMNRIAGLV